MITPNTQQRLKSLSEEILKIIKESANSIDNIESASALLSSALLIQTTVTDVSRIIGRSTTQNEIQTTDNTLTDFSSTTPTLLTDTDHIDDNVPEVVQECLELVEKEVEEEFPIPRKPKNPLVKKDEELDKAYNRYVNALAEYKDKGIVPAKTDIVILDALTESFNELCAEKGIKSIAKNDGYMLNVLKGRALGKVYRNKKLYEELKRITLSSLHTKLYHLRIIETSNVGKKIWTQEEFDVVCKMNKKFMSKEEFAESISKLSKRTYDSIKINLNASLFHMHLKKFRNIGMTKKYKLQENIK